MESTLRRFGAGWFVVGCGVWLACAGACGGRSVTRDDDARGGEAGDPSTGGGGTVVGGSNGASSGGTSGTGTSGGGDAAAPGGGRGGTGPVGRGGAVTGGAGGPGGDYTYRGVCDRWGHATVTTRAFSGYEELYLWTEEALTSDDLREPTDSDLVCRIRFDVSRVGPAPAGCADLDDLPCDWTHTVEYSNPQVLIDVDGACARSEAGWNQTFIDEMNGSRVSYGYVLSFLGHDETLMTYSETTGEWIDFARSYWDEMTGEFEYIARLGACRY